MFASLKHRAVLAIKQLVYARRGEPYSVNGKTLRFVPGTRPILTKYRDSENGVSRNDALQMDLFIREIRPGDLVLDIGAHAGECAIVMTALAGQSGRVIAFEPDKFARTMLERNLLLNPGIGSTHVEALALSDTVGSATLFSRGGDANSSLSLYAISGDREDEVVELEVKLDTLDGYIARMGLGTPNLIKIDTEGAEIRILKGAKTVLAGQSIVVCELHPYAWKDFGNSLCELQALLSEAGRSMRYLDGESVDSDNPKYGIVLLERIA